MPVWKVRDRGFVLTLASKFQRNKMFLPREVACSALDRQSLNFWRAVSSHSSHHLLEALLAQFNLYVLKCGLKPYSFHFIWLLCDKIDYYYCVRSGSNHWSRQITWLVPSPAIKGQREDLKENLPMRHWYNVVLKLAQRLRHWANIKIPLDPLLVVVGHILQIRVIDPLLF